MFQTNKKQKRKKNIYDRLLSPYFLISMGCIAIGVYFQKNPDIINLGKIKENAQNNIGILKGSEPFTCTVTVVLDGDTFDCLYKDKKSLRIRLFGIDAPEKKQDYGEQSKKILISFIQSKEVTIYTQEKDKYNRLLGIVFQNKININKSMVASGAAWNYKRYNNDKNYQILEDEAQRKKIGLWGVENPTNPENFRHKQDG